MDAFRKLLTNQGYVRSIVVLQPLGSSRQFFMIMSILRTTYLCSNTATEGHNHLTPGCVIDFGFPAREIEWTNRRSVYHLNLLG
ncbi:hypothetical protein NPIL_32031 [Nephila pilipes]|uniref:Uncharacterized protein n=1 Tax=Nephila pilipes TaxID=299642 RepID=A0A8X6N9J0_NEPPI|nr:hypothetical protein NPIL_32031 [Nephila pilipes]